MLSEKKLCRPKHEREAIARERRNQKRRERRAWNREASELVRNYGMVVIEPEALVAAR